LLQLQNIERLKDGLVLTITYDKLLDICFQNAELSSRYCREADIAEIYGYARWM